MRISPNKIKEKIMVFCDHYEPGYRAGGPITSIKSMVARLSTDFDYYIVTRDRDLLSSQPYKIKLDDWINDSKSKNYYISKKNYSLRLIKNLIQEISPSIIYLNSFFSFKFSISIIILYKLKIINNCKIIICPRGEFKRSALFKGKFKKYIYIILSKSFSFYSKVLWQATNKLEHNYIKRIFGSKIEYSIASNLTRPIINKKDLLYSIKKQKILKLVYVGRIHKIKNLLYNLDVLSKIHGNISFDIIGSVQDLEYWSLCQSKIKKLPNNIKVNYLGDMPNNRVIKLMNNYHFLFLLTLGENFGQSIFEALSIGLPVITSDQTPWSSIKENNAGWTLPLKSKKDIIKILNQCVNMSQTKYNSFVNGAIQCASDYDKNSGVLEANKEMFKIAMET